MIDTSTLALAHFEPLIGAVFHICDAHYQEDLTLIEARPLTDFSGMGRKAGSFHLTFTGSSTTHVMEQGLRRFSHETIGEFEMVIAPRAQLPEGTFRYTAIFN